MAPIPSDPPTAGDGARLGPVVADLDRPRAGDPVTLAVVADPHLAVVHTGTWKVLHRTEARLRRALDIARGVSRGFDGTDAVVFAGDQTHDGRKTEAGRFDELAAGLDQPWTAVPGNHDVPKAFDDHEGVALSALRRRYAGDAAAVESGDSYPLVLRVGGVRIVCLNTAAPPDVDLAETWGGAVGPEQLERLRTALAEDPEAPTVVVAHHNLEPLPEHEPAYPWDRFPADDAGALSAVLSDNNVPLAVTGHHHVPAVRDHGDLTELMAPAACSFPQAMLTVRVGPDGTRVRFVPLAGPDGICEAYWHAENGTRLGRGVLDLTRTRVARF